MPDETAGKPEETEGTKPVELGDAGKKALDTERSARKAAEQKAATAEQKAASFEEQIAAINKTLGLAGDPDPKKLADELGAVQAENRRLKAEGKVTVAAMAAGADPELTWAFLAAKGVALDPAADDFDKKVTEAVKTAVTEKPALLTRAPQGDGGPRGRPVGGGSGDMNEWIRHQAGHT